MGAVETIRIFGEAPDSIVDGPGLRYGVFVQGCKHACPGCHNPESQPMDGGKVEQISDVVSRIAKNRLCHGVTISGGEPFEQAEACAELARQVRDLGMNVWVYSGYTYEDLASGNVGQAALDLLNQADVLIDGPFVQVLHSYDLQWRGSSNQRIIDMNETRARGAIVLWSAEESFPEKPASW